MCPAVTGCERHIWSSMCARFRLRGIQYGIVIIPHSIKWKCLLNPHMYTSFIKITQTWSRNLICVFIQSENKYPGYASSLSALFPCLQYYPKPLLSIDQALFKEGLHDQRDSSGMSLTCSLIKHIRSNWMTHCRWVVLSLFCHWWLVSHCTEQFCCLIERVRTAVVISMDSLNSVVCCFVLLDFTDQSQGFTVRFIFLTLPSDLYICCLSDCTVSAW